MKVHHLLFVAIFSAILAGGSFTCHSGDDSVKKNRHALVVPVDAPECSGSRTVIPSCHARFGHTLVG